MSNREFKEKFGHVSGSWRGKKPIQRNAIIALAHFKDQTAVPDLIELIKNDVRPVIRGTAAWALGKIGDKEALDTLMNLREKEKDQEVIEEMSKGIEMLQEI
jgi:epoxyqueuosine reductase